MMRIDKREHCKATESLAKKEKKREKYLQSIPMQYISSVVVWLTLWIVLEYQIHNDTRRFSRSGPEFVKYYCFPNFTANMKVEELTTSDITRMVWNDL